MLIYNNSELNYSFDSKIINIHSNTVAVNKINPMASIKKTLDSVIITNTTGLNLYNLRKVGHCSFCISKKLKREESLTVALIPMIAYDFLENGHWNHIYIQLQ